LKKTFQEFTAAKNNFQSIATNRNNLVHKIDDEIAKVSGFHDFMNARISTNSDLTIKSLFDVLISNSHKALLDNLNALDEHVSLQDWQDHEDSFKKLYAINLETNQSEFFSVHPFRFLKRDVFSKYQHLSDLKKDLENSLEAIENISERLDFVTLPVEIDTFFEI
jgi:hypothetical protein